MKRLFLLLFLIPCLLHASFSKKEHLKIMDRASAEWKRHDELVQQFQNLDLDKKEQNIGLLHEAIGCCQRAIGHCDYVLKKISKKKKDERREKYWVAAKNQRFKDKSTLSQSIVKLHALIEQTRKDAVLGKAISLYQEGEKKAQFAHFKSQSCPRLSPRVEEVVSALNEVAKLYEEACGKVLDALAVVSSYPEGNYQTTFKDTARSFRELAEKHKKEAAEWPVSTTARKVMLKERLHSLKEDCKIFSEKGLTRSCYELQKQAILLLEQLIEVSSKEEGNGYKEELARIKSVIANFEKGAGFHRLDDDAPMLSKEEFEEREMQRIGLFFKSDLLLKQDALNDDLPRVMAIDGQMVKHDRDFVLYTDQFYRFLIQSEHPFPQMFVKVYRGNRLVHEEAIPIPCKNTPGWERYLHEGMLFIPETLLKSKYKLDLRLRLAYDAKDNFSLIVAHKGADARYQFVFSLDPGTSLYECSFSPPPPWQLEALRKPGLLVPSKRIDNLAELMLNNVEQEVASASDARSFPLLDQLVEELKRDPIALAGYVQNEIALDPFLHQENGILLAPAIRRNPGTTYLEKLGSAWEQCELLVYLLRKAGYRATYFFGDSCKLPKDFVEKLLFASFPENQETALLNYPWVAVLDGDEWVPLFPWMKEMQIREGHDLYSFLPEEYASADRWILQYLKRDEKILQHIGPDGDDTAGVLFARFVDKQLRNHGLSLNDVGVQRTQLKKQFFSWKDFPRATLPQHAQTCHSLSGIDALFAKVKIEVFSQKNPQKAISCTMPLADLSCGPSSIHFSSRGEDRHLLHLQIAGKQMEPSLELDGKDSLINIKVTYETPPGMESLPLTHTFTIAKGTNAALCTHFGGATPYIASQYYEQFSAEKDEKKRLNALLSFVGAAYFEKCSRAQKTLADLHKVHLGTLFAFGLAKLAPDLTKDSFKDGEDLSMPQVDMFWFRYPISADAHQLSWHQEPSSAHMQCESLATVDSSSNEHQILREVFNDPYPISTVRLLQLAHQQQQKKGVEGEGFLSFTAESFATANQKPEAAQETYFSHLKDVDLKKTQAASPQQWNTLKTLLDSNHPLSCWSYAYMTPGLTTTYGSVYEEMASLILCPLTQYALISHNTLVFQGGLGSPLPSRYLTSSAIKQWQLVPTGIADAHYALRFTPQPVTLPEILKHHSDVRLEHKPLVSQVADPVDIISGAFYCDEVDLCLLGAFPLEIRRNYNSQNPLLGDFGYGWKLGLNPFLFEQEGKRFAAESDGTVIAYSYNAENNRWEILPQDNPDLCNFNLRGIGSSANPFHAYIENDILYGSDGSQRFFKDGLLQKWVNIHGSTLFFSYENRRLSRIESSNGDFCGFHYNREGKISEIYAKDGRRISYDYNAQVDLIRVTLPNTAVISYEYDAAHRILRETKAHGKVLENIYDESGRVKEQRSPMGQAQTMITTAAFDYAEGITTVTDAGGGKTLYKIFEKQIYQVIDPLGYCTLQSWFIDEKSWFDPEAQQVRPWNQPGAAVRSVKSTTDKRGLTTSYFYDARGNPEEISLHGNDLTGNGISSVVKKLSYNERDLCVEENVDEQKTKTIYDATFPYLPKRIEKYIDDSLISYVEWEYNALGQIEKEDNAGAITHWTYDLRGFPLQKTQLTGTDDPDVITTYTYNHQGQCIQITSAEGTEINDYDLMGNQTESQIFSPSGALLSATYWAYDLNHAPIWQQTANVQNITYYDYHVCGLPKAKRQVLGSSVAYTLYEYDPRGYLVREIDPRGHCTYRDYDALGNIKSETKEWHSTHFSYEPGGLLEVITSPYGAQTRRHYTTNGLLKEEVYPDGTKNAVVYDIFGRPILETKNAIAWQITYDDEHHTVTRTHLSTQQTEISEFDARGNLVRFTDRAGYTVEKTYDNLNRIKTETTHTGKKTTWNYIGNATICTLPNAERITQHSEGGRIVASEVTDAQGTLIASSYFHFDPHEDREEIAQGEEKTITWKNALGLPIQVQKGNVVQTYEYDTCGNCIASIDGDGRITQQEFDGLNRLIRKTLPDGSTTEYDYDLDSHLIAYRLPNGTVWRADYDSMGRKRFEELQSNGAAAGQWEFVYDNGYLKEVIDPLKHLHTYHYDLYGRLTQENVGAWSRTFTYDARGLLDSAEQTKKRGERSLIKRSYDPDGNLSSELVYLNSYLIQDTHQKWDTSQRSLQIGNHERHFTYQNNQLTYVSTGDLQLAYTYDLSGSLVHIATPLSQTTLGYDASGLPTQILSQLPDSSYQESLDWYPSGKLLAYASPSQQKQFTYTSRGLLQNDSTETYEFDFGGPGIGVRTKALRCAVPYDGLDFFDKPLTELIDQDLLTATYNLMGQVTTHNQRSLEWDPWGRLICVSEETLTWEASYDALGRRLQTRYTPADGRTLTTTSFYDPEQEFQEIGVQQGDKTYWKIHGPRSCDAIIDETSSFVVLVHNGLDQLAAVLSPTETLFTDSFPSSYGPQSSPSIPSNLLTYAQSLNWHSSAQDPTGLIWMGERYYDPRTGRFLSPDPLGYPQCIDLYTYAGGDPINFMDPTGRFFSPVYQPLKATVLTVGTWVSNAWNSPRFQRTGKALLGFTEAATGAAFAPAPFAPFGAALMAHDSESKMTTSNGYEIDVRKPNQITKIKNQF